MTDRQPEALPPALEGEVARALESEAWANADAGGRRRLILEAVRRAMRAPGWELADTYRRVLRDQRIRAEFDGVNMADLATRHQLTVRQVRRIVAPRRRRK